MTTSRPLSLVAEHDGPDSWSLVVAVAANGDVVFTGQDLGPRTAPVSSDGEYEYGFRVLAGDTARAVAVLGGDEGESLMDLLARKYVGRQAFGIRPALEVAGIPTHLWTYS